LQRSCCQARSRYRKEKDEETKRDKKSPSKDQNVKKEPLDDTQEDSKATVTDLKIEKEELEDLEPEWVDPDVENLEV